MFSNSYVPMGMPMAQPPSSTQMLLDALDRSGKHLEQLDSQIAAARQKKLELKQHADNIQVTLEQQRNAERDAQSAAAAAQAMRQALEAEVASYQENNTQLKQTIHDLTSQLAALEVASMTEKEKFIDQCEELTLATRALLKQCNEAGDVLLRIKTGLGSSGLEASMGQGGQDSPHALAPAGSALSM